MNQTTVLLFLSTLPVIIILLWVYQKDKEKEPFLLLIQFFGLGVLSCFLVLFISKVLGNFIPFMNINTENKNTIYILLYSFIGVALVEESCKWIMLYKKGYHHKEFDESYDILLYAIFVSLGFAFFENVASAMIKQNMKLAILRAISAVPAHACDAVFMGYHLTMAKHYYYHHNEKKERQHKILSIVIPTLLHGIYDFCLLINVKFFIHIYVFFIVTMYAISIQKLKKSSRENHRIIKKSIFCSKCGAKVNGTFCPKCGSKQDE